MKINFEFKFIFKDLAAHTILAIIKFSKIIKFLWIVVLCDKNLTLIISNYIKITFSF